MSESRTRIIVAILVVALIAIGGYAMYQRSTVKTLAAQNDRVTTSLNDTRSQVDALAAKINTLSAPPPVQAPPVQITHSAKAKAAHHVRRDDPRWKQVQAKLDAQALALDETRQGLDATRQNLDGTRTELSGSIARTHDEIVVLQRKGERNYFEFDLDKSKQFQHSGPFGIRVKKANNKNLYADLELMVDDAKVTKKHVNVFEPVMFYAGDSGQPVELVINSITKNHIKGYVSEPKYRRAELAGMSSANAAANAAAASANGTTASTTETAAPVRRKLELPKN